LVEARERFASAVSDAIGDTRAEVLSEYAEIEVLVGDRDRAVLLLEGRDRGIRNSSSELVEVVDSVAMLRAGLPDAAFALVMSIPLNRPSLNPGYQSRVRATRALVASLCGRPEARTLGSEAVQFAEQQGARTWRALAEISLACASGTCNPAIEALPEGLDYVASFAAELIVRQLGELDAQPLERIRAVAERSPERWRPALRAEIASGRAANRLPCARLLDVIGEKADVPTLRQIGREPRLFGQDRALGRGLARRLAPVVTIKDLGRVSVEIGPLAISGGEIRRKVLSLLCFLLTRPRWEATREEVIEAMWPEMNPSSAANSLNQSVYFLRRVFEGEYSDDTTAGYVHQDSDLLWLDRDLVRAASAHCAALVAEFGRSQDPRSAVALSEQYRGRFALDFAYEEWATDYREWLHVAYLHVVESQIRSDLDEGEYQRGIRLARSALEIEPRNEELELSLLRLLRRSGAHSAAAEQYSRYAAVLRSDLGVDPPAFDAV
jgi:DNA-binding SARP family transcriptional activator